MISSDAQIFSPNRTALLLDIDGTLLDIAPTPDAVVVPASLSDDLASLSENLGGALALVSGRAIADIDRIFAPLVLTAVGGHGAEMRLVAGGKPEQSHSTPLDPDLRNRFRRIAAIGDNILVEDKGYSIALHFRLAPDYGPAVVKHVDDIIATVEPGMLEVLPGKAVIEIKKIGFDKGSGIVALMQSAPFAGRRPIFIGDDVTDEAGFAAANALGGCAFSVGRVVHGAALKFDGPADVRRWLRAVATALRAPATANTDVAFNRALDTVPK